MGEEYYWKPRFPPIGYLVLVLYIGISYSFFSISIYGRPLSDVKRSTIIEHSCPLSKPNQILTGFVCASSFLNVSSHGLVAMGMLDDTYVLSILLGVGFDVATRVLYLIWWICLTRALQQSNNEGDTMDGMEWDLSTIFFYVVNGTSYIIHMIIHVRALFMYSSHDRLNDVLNNALNDIRGVPGKAYRNFIFVYTDLGSHMMPLLLSSAIIWICRVIHIALAAFGLLSIFARFIFQRIPLHSGEEELTTNSAKLISITASGKVMCSCSICRKKEMEKGCKTSFCIDLRTKSVCHLWLCSFEQLCSMMKCASIVSNLKSD